ncbi:unnamed protein product [Discula destructiva]
MVKHARRNHAPGGGVMGESDDDDDDSPTTPNSQSPWGIPVGYNSYWQGHIHRPLAPQTAIPLRTFQRVDSLGSNGPEYNPHGDYAQAEIVRRMSQHELVRGMPHHEHQYAQQQQQRALPPPPAHHHHHHQQGPIYKVEYDVDPYQSQQPRTVDIHVQPPSLHNSPGSYHSAPSPPDSSGPADAYTHQPAQAATHALHDTVGGGQSAQPRMGYSFIPQQSIMATPSQQQYQPAATQTMYEQHYHTTSGPMGSSLGPLTSGPMEMQASAYGGAPAIPSFHTPMSFYALNDFQDPKMESPMMLPTQRLYNTQ